MRKEIGRWPRQLAEVKLLSMEARAKGSPGLGIRKRVGRRQLSVNPGGAQTWGALMEDYEGRERRNDANQYLRRKI